jgi:hypothetical protein
MLAFGASAISLVVVLVNWFQSNVMPGNLDRIDGKHASITIFQVFLILVYWYAVGLGADLDNVPPALAMQSLTAVLVGSAAAAAWWYASKDRKLLSDELDGLGNRRAALARACRITDGSVDSDSRVCRSAIVETGLARLSVVRDCSSAGRSHRRLSH